MLQLLSMFLTRLRLQGDPRSVVRASLHFSGSRHIADRFDSVFGSAVFSCQADRQISPLMLAGPIGCSPDADSQIDTSLC